LNCSVRRIAKAVAAAVVVVGSAELRAQGVIQFSLPAEPLADALRTVGTQTQTSIVFDPTLVEGKQAPAVDLRTSLDDVLSRLLSGTGIGYRFLNEHTVVLTRPGGDRSSSTGADIPPSEESNGSGEAEERQKASIDSFRLAQTTEATSAGDTSVEKNQNESSRQNEKIPRVELQEVLVTGTNIRGQENVTSPVIVLDRQYIDSTGYATTSALIESLPQNFALESQSGVSVPGISANPEQGSSINLRGVGEGTTLILLNGHRMAPSDLGQAVDISAIPLSAIERVEILTDGASAVYGSDAIGGVVNFVLRDDYDGVETSARDGYAKGGIHEYRATQTMGHSWESGNALLSLGYYSRDLLRANARSFVPDTSLIGSLLPRDKDYSATFSGHQGIGEKLTVFADALYTKRNSFNEGGVTTDHENTTSTVPQLTTTGGLTLQLGARWQAELTGSYASENLGSIGRGDLVGAGGGQNVMADSAISSGTLKLDGPVLSLLGGVAKVAIGGEYRSESFHLHTTDLDGTPVNDQRNAQDVRSAFIEGIIPVVGAANAFSGVHRIDLSLAARYDDYSVFGHSIDPKVGLMWEPIAGLRIRSSYGTSYKAPSLFDYSTANNTAYSVEQQPDPGSPTGLSNQLTLYGSDASGLSAQKATDFSLGANWTPGDVPGLDLGVNYFRVRYRDEIVNPTVLSTTLILGNPTTYGSLFTRNPTPAEVNQYIAIANQGLGFFPLDQNLNPIAIEDFNPSATDVLIDQRLRNLSITNTSGFDFTSAYDFKLSRNTFHLGLDGTYILHRYQQVTPTDPQFDTVNTIFNPPHLRMRGSAGWGFGGWAVNAFVNHTGSYIDNRIVAAPNPVAAYTTIDLRIAFSFKSVFSDGPLSGLNVAVSAQNLFDRNPPHTSVITNYSDIGFDPTNASPLGRLLALEVQYQW
jgi:iron complex outermembrane recepter protein